MRLFVVLVVFMMIFGACGSDPVVQDAANSYAVPPRNGRPAVPGPGDPVETRSIVKFADGSIDEYTTSTYDPVKKTQLVKQERFSASGQLVEETDYTYNDDNGLLTTKITKGDDNRLKSRVVYQYEGANLVKENFVGRNGKLVSSYDYTYDPSGNMLSRVISNPSGVKQAETVYTYQNGMMVSSESKDNAGRAISVAKNEYDADKNLIKQTIFNAQGKVSRIIMAAWENGKEVRNVQYGPDGTTVQLQTISEYGAQGQLVRRIIDNVEGQSKQILEYEYTFQK